MERASLIDGGRRRGKTPTTSGRSTWTRGKPRGRHANPVLERVERSHNPNFFARALRAVPLGEFPQTPRASFVNRADRTPGGLSAPRTPRGYLETE
jgi:hypothetical protein